MCILYSFGPAESSSDSSLVLVLCCGGVLVCFYLAIEYNFFCSLFCTLLVALSLVLFLSVP